MENIKTILAMLGLVLIGFFAGFFLHRHLTHLHLERVSESGTAEGFREQFYSIIQPTNEQKQQIQPLIEDHIEKMRNLNREFRDNRTVLINDLHHHLEHHLDTHQMERFKEFSRRLKKKGIKKRKKRGERGKNRE